MKLILASDIHANLPALEAFFSYLKTEGLENEPLFFLGDYVNLGPFPEEVVSLIRSSGAQVCLAGNHDRYITNIHSLDKNPYFGSKEGILHTRWTQQQMSQDNIEWLRVLPTRYQLDVHGVHIDMVHGRHGSDEETLDASRLQTDKPILYVCGHTHVSRNQRVGLAKILNPGSLGKPLDTDNRASFGVISIEPSSDASEHPHIDFEVIRIPYDIKKTTDALEEKKVPWRKGIIESLKTAVYTDES